MNAPGIQNWLLSARLRLYGFWVVLMTLFTMIRPTPPDPLQDDWNHRKQSLTLKTNLRLKYLETGNPEGEPLIFLHGITASSRAWSLLVPFLEERYRLYFLDLRGHGDSDKPRHGYSIQALAEDVLEFMEQKALQSAHLVGHSLGGFICQYLAIYWPNRIQSLSLIGTALKARGHGRLAPVEAAQPVQMSSRLVSENPRGPQPHNPAFLKHIVREAVRIPPRVWRQGIHGVFGEDFSTSLKSVQVPSLIIWGQRDPLFSHSSQAMLRAALPHATVIIYPNAGHNPQYQYPQKIAEDIQRFLSENVSFSSRSTD